jgi:hypothetical protein
VIRLKIKTISTKPLLNNWMTKEALNPGNVPQQERLYRRLRNNTPVLLKKTQTKNWLRLLCKTDDLYNDKGQRRLFVGSRMCQFTVDKQ